MRRTDATTLVRLYVPILGAGLLLEGAALLIVNRLDLPVGGLASDTRHNLLHVVWGAALLGIAATHPTGTWVAWAAVVFGVFYILLGVLGIVVDDPFGLLLGPAENAFHLTVGPLALALGWWALRSPSEARRARTRSLK